MSDLLSVSEAARELGVASSTIHLYERTGKLAALKTERGMRLFERSEVERFARERDERRNGK
jgi:excisionase family DNA binding protein